MVNRPSVLALTHEPPLPAISGTRVRSLNLVRQLAGRGWRVSLFALGFGELPGSTDRAELESLCERVEIADLHRSQAARYARILLDLARGRAFQQSFFYSPGAAAMLGPLLDDGRWDVLLADQLYMYPYVPPGLRERTALDCHNVELRRVETMAAALWPRPRGVMARLQLGPVARLEREAVRSVARVLAVSESEVRHFERLASGSVSLVPNGVDCERQTFRLAVPAEPRLLFVGSMGYSANADGASYLVREIVPRIRTRGAQLTFVGGGASRALERQAAASAVPVDIAGTVESTEPYFERSRLVVVPLRFGGGTRLKILEAMARGVPVVSTTIGCEGLEVAHERDLLVADDPDAFAASIDRLLVDDELCASLAHRARALVERRYDWRVIGEALEDALGPIAGDAKPRAGGGRSA
jgi:polysaccharide biosynthesis protein PslH